MNDEEFVFDNIVFKITYGLSVNNNSLDYKDLISLLHPNYVWLYAEDKNYQGNYYAVGYDDVGKFYFIQGSFGSCSGCDWLQSIKTIEEGIKLVTYIKKDIIMKPTREEMITYLKQTLWNTSLDDNSTINILIEALERRYYVAYRKVHPNDKELL